MVKNEINVNYSEKIKDSKLLNVSFSVEKVGSGNFDEFRFWFYVRI